MPIPVSCPKCQTRYQVADAAAGKSVRCKSCQHVFSVSAASPPRDSGVTARPSSPKAAAATETRAGAPRVRDEGQSPSEADWPEEKRAVRRQPAASGSKVPWIIAGVSAGVLLMGAGGGAVFLLTRGDKPQNAPAIAAQQQPVAALPSKGTEPVTPQTVQPSQLPSAEVPKSQPSVVPIPAPQNPVPSAPKDNGTPVGAIPTVPAALSKNLVIAPQESRWDFRPGQVRAEKDALILESSGPRVWVASKEQLPENFQLLIKCAVDFPGKTGAGGTRSNLRTLVVRFGTDNTDLNAGYGDGATFQFLKSRLTLWRNGRTVQSKSAALPTSPFLATVTKEGGVYSFAVDGNVLMKYVDRAPLTGTHKCAIGGLNARIVLGEVTVVNLSAAPSNPIVVGPAAKPAPARPAPGVAETSRPTQPAIVTPAFADGPTQINLPNVGGGIITPDYKTLLLSLTNSGAIAFFDTLTDKESKRVEVEFRPTALAIQGPWLFAAAKGSPGIHVLELATGKEVKEIKIPGEPIDYLACHPTQGWLYASNMSNQVFAVDPAKGTVRLSGIGHYLAVDQVSGDYLYAGLTKPPSSKLVFRNQGRMSTISVVHQGPGATILKYRVKGPAMQLVGGNENAGRNAVAMSLSPDGRQIAMASPGGWSGKLGPAAGGMRYVIPVFDTVSMVSMVGQVDLGAYPKNIAFHPALKLGAALREGTNAEVTLFSTKSFVSKKKWSLRQGPRGRISSLSGVLTFAAEGSKLIWVSKPGFGDESKDSTIFIFPLELGEQDRDATRAALAAKLAPPKVIPGKKQSGKTPDVPMAGEPSQFDLPRVEGGALAPDNKTLILSYTNEGAIGFFDTMLEKEVKKIDVDFKPAILAVQGKMIFAIAKGTSIVHVLDAVTAKEIKEIAVPGEPLAYLACHPGTGPVYVSNLANQVFAIDPVKGMVTRTTAVGLYLGMDRAEGKHLFTGITKTPPDRLIIKERPGSVVASFVRGQPGATLLKYRIAGMKLELVDANENAGRNAVALTVSPDGKQVALSSPGGWSSKTAPGVHYVIPVFDGRNIKSMLGQVDLDAYPKNIAFHPVLKYGVGLRVSNKNELALFNSRSYAVKKRWHAEGAKRTMSLSGLLLFAGEGTKIVWVSQPGFSNDKAGSTLFIYPLDLTEQDKEALKEAKVSARLQGPVSILSRNEGRKANNYLD